MTSANEIHDLLMIRASLLLLITIISTDFEWFEFSFLAVFNRCGDFSFIRCKKMARSYVCELLH